MLPQGLLQIHGENFLLHDSGPAAGQNRILIFGTQKGLQMLSDAKVWLADGTFKTAPRLFKQNYTVHGSLQGFTLPGVYACLPNKQQKTYKKFWAALWDHLGMEDDDDSKTLLVDFEKASYQAAQEEFEEIDLGGCFFHFKQALHRHVQDLGLQVKYGIDPEFRMRVSSLGALAFLPVADVPAAFDLVAASFMEDEQGLITYFEGTWVGKKQRNGHRKPPIFPIDLWNCYTWAKEGGQLTTNNAEQFHRKFADYSVQGSHPTMPAFIESLKKQQALTNNDMSKLELGQTKEEARETKIRNARIQTLIGNFDETKDAGALVKGIATLYLL